MFLSCKKDEDTTLQNEPNAFLSSTEIGTDRNGEPLLVFDKTTQQLSLKPTLLQCTILDDAGERYAEIKLDETPAPDVPLSISIIGDLGVKNEATRRYTLLKEDTRYWYLWCDNTHTGIIFYPDWTKNKNTAAGRWERQNRTTVQAFSLPLPQAA